MANKTHSSSNSDPIVLALVQNRLDQIAVNMGWVMIRSARSPIFNQSHDEQLIVVAAAELYIFLTIWGEN